MTAIKTRAETYGRTRISETLDALENQMRSLKDFQIRYDAAKSDAERGEVMSWFIHAVTTNLATNLRVDLLAKAMAQLEVSAASEGN